MSDQRLEQKEELYDEERRRREREKEKQKEEERAKLKEITEIKKQKEVSKLEKIKIPIIALDEGVEIETKEVKIDKKIPEIKEEELKISVPVIELEKPVIELKQVELEKIIPTIDVKESKLEIPLIRLDKLGEVRSIITTFDERLPPIRPKIKQVPRIPIYRILSGNAVKESVSSFDDRVGTQILEYLSREKLEEEIKKEEKVSAEGAGGEPPSDEKEVEETPDIIDLVFGVSNSKLSSRGPKVILYKELEEDSTIGSFETLCIRIYREKQGGEPEFKPRKGLDEFNIREIEKWDNADRKIITIDMNNDKEKAKKWFCERNLREPLRRAIIGNVGFIIFKTRDEKLYEYCRKVLDNLEKEIEHPLNVIYLEPKRIVFSKKRELSSLAWGNLNLDDFTAPVSGEKEGIERFIGTGVFDDIFNKLSKSLFEKYLEKLKDEDNSAYSNATKSHKGEESIEHKEMKWFLVKYLTKKLIKEGILHSKNPKKPKAFEINEFITTEEELDGKVADVMYNSEVYEIETLFAEDREGKAPNEKLNYTIDKYKGIDKVEKINIVLDNLTFLRHLKMLKNVKLNKPEKERERIKFYTLDIQNNKLIPMEDVIKRVKRLFTEGSF